MTKEKAIVNARYLIKHSLKRAFIFNTRSDWSFTTNSKEVTQAAFHEAIEEYQEIKLNE